MPVRSRKELAALLERRMRRSYEELAEGQELEAEENLVKSYIVETNKENLDSLWIPGERLETFAGTGTLRSFSLKYRNEIFREIQEELPVKELAMRLWGSEAASVLSTLRASAQLQRSTALSAVGVKLKPDE